MKGGSMTYFDTCSVAYGLKGMEFEHLNKRTKKKLLRLMSRISEKSYRRGFQHGKDIERPTVDASHLRFDVTLHRSPYTDIYYPDGRWAPKSGMSALDRLWCEYGVLWELGFMKDEQSTYTILSK